MKNLARTIDRILKVEPDLKSDLMPIRHKFSRWPKHEMSYWKELLGVLNSEPMQKHPKREEIRKIVSSLPVRRKLPYSFKQVGPQDKIIGALPENISDRLKRHDRRIIDLAKKNVEAEMTADEEALIKIARTNALLDIDQDKIWVTIKDHFNLWKFRGINLHIKLNGEMLVVTTDSDNGGGGGSTFLMQTPMGTIKMDRESFIQFFKSMGIKPPPGMIPPDEGNNDDS